MTDINLLRQYKSDPQLVMGSKHQINKFKKCTFINHVWVVLNVLNTHLLWCDIAVLKATEDDVWLC